MLDGMVTIETVPAGTMDNDLLTDKAKRFMTIVPLDGMTLDKIVSLKNADKNKWKALLSDSEIEFLRPMTMPTLMRMGDDLLSDNDWAIEEQQVRSIVEDSIVIKSSIVLTDDDNGKIWTLTMPKPTIEQLHAVMGV